MYTVYIGEEERREEEVRESWINQQINRRRHDGEAVCVRVSIDDGGESMFLASCGCPRGRPGQWSPGRKQRMIHDLWLHHGLDKCDFTGGNVVAFLKRLDNIL